MKTRIGFGLLILSAVVLQIALSSGDSARSVLGGAADDDESRPAATSALKACSVSYGSNGAITIPEAGAATPYPQERTVAGVASPIADLDIDLASFTHSYPDDLDILLVGPQGQSVMLMSDAGGEFDVNNAFIRFDDEAAAAVPDQTQIPSTPAQVLRPADYEAAETMPTPAPPGPYGTSLSVFDGTNPNGTWRLYVSDDASPDGGSVHMQMVFDSKCPKCFGEEADYVGTNAADNIDADFTGVVHARGGDDVITETSPTGDVDLICGGAGDDTIRGGVDDDKIDGGVGDDNVQGGDDDDYVRGNRGRDTIRGNDGNDTLSGGLGIEQICDGGNGTDTANACDGNVTRVP